MAVYKRPGKSTFYWTRFTFNGVEIRQSTKSTNKKAAQDFEAALRVQLAYRRIGIDQLGNKAEKPDIFRKVVVDFLDNLETKESTKRRYSVASKALLEFFGNAIVTTIDTADVEKFRAWRKKQNKKAPFKKLKKNPKTRVDKPIRPATVNREMMLLSSLFRWLIRTGKVSKNPVNGVTFLRENNDQTRVVTDQEFRAYLMACSQPLRDVAVVMFETGMRPSEVFNLKKDDIDLARERIQIREGKTDAARRRLTMTPNAERILAARAKAAPGDLLFPGGRKGDKQSPIVKLTNAHHAAIEAAKLKSFRLYDLRHTFATHLTQSGVDLMTVKTILGHSRLEMVQRYSHPTEQHQADAIQKLEAFRNPKANVLSLQKTA